ncbi:outer membrane beta-barrel protein [Hyphomicrobium sp.]|uniref:outer membrane beta-barrel protein n=1 Tax=Hyphomicrobium sp. TaxID=82 RepID=UPI0025BAE104|nr:outer membrane beta-barrel protein [Hyphomicrobium sp.]MCC7251741.1 outer membrane beta-barrel protein [Hyphomicrobium sp.]
MVRRLGLILFGFAVATLVAALSHAPSANAQEWTPSPRDLADVAAAYETAQRLRRPAGDSLYDQDDDPAGEGGPGENSFSDAEEIVPGDGEASAPADGPALADGVIDLAEPEPPEDGADPTRDTRPSEDLDAFRNPPAGYDPLLFQVEDIDPVATDRRPARLARFEPYDPIGIRIGSFVFFPEIEIGGLATDNVLSSPDAHSDIAAEIRSVSRLVSNWSVHALELKGTSLTTFHDDFPSEDDRAWGVEARGRLDITRRTNLQAIAGRDVSREDRSAIDANQVGERAEVTVDRAEVALNHRFNRLTVQLRGAVSDATYSDTNGVSNADRDTLETRAAVRAAWAFKPTLAVFAEQELNQRDKGATPADGIARDSDGTRTRVGLDFGSTGAVLRGTIGVGYGRQTPDDRRLSAVDAFLFDANLAWRPSEVTSFLLTAQSDIYDTTTLLSGGVVAHTVGLEARHAFRRYLIASAGVVYTHYDYDATPFTEDQWLSFAGLEYYASPELVLFARYEHLDFASNDVDGDYESDEVRLGVRVRR